jgi:hypothetical protein
MFRVAGAKGNGRNFLFGPSLRSSPQAYRNIQFTAPRPSPLAPQPSSTAPFPSNPDPRPSTTSRTWLPPPSPLALTVATRPSHPRPALPAHCFSPLTPRSSPLAPRPSLLAPRPSLLKKRLLGRDDRNPSSLWGKDQLPAEGAVVEAGLDSICLYQILDNN